MKNCTKCKEKKNLKDFNKDKSRDDGLESICKCCRKAQRKKSSDKKDLSKEKECGKCKKNKQLKDFYKGRWHECKECAKSKRNYGYKSNPNIQKKRSTEYRKKNRDRCNQTVRRWREKNSDYDRVYNKKRWETQKEELKKRNKKYQEENKDKIKAARKKYYKENKKEILKKNIKYEMDRRKRDPLYKMSKNLRCRTRIAFKRSRWSKNKSNEIMLGCTYKEAFNHIESQFQEGMTWDNHTNNGWHIDHIIPLSYAKTEEELIKLCHYTNLQPLWAEDNLKKSNKKEGY